MLVTVNMAPEVFEYFREYNLDDLVDCLLQQYDISNLPQAELLASSLKKFERKVNVSDPTYLALYKVVGPRSNKVSLSRLLEFAYNMDVLANPYFEVQPTLDKHDPVPGLIDRAYRSLAEAKRHAPENHSLSQITQIVLELKKSMENV